MAVVLTFTLPTRPRAEAAHKSSVVGGLSAAGAFRWLRDPETGKLVCRWDSEAADPDPHL